MIRGQLNSSSAKSSNQLRSNKPKTRFGFNLKKDLSLLKASLSANPWQLGEKNWSDVSINFNSTHGADICPRTAKNRITLLMKKYKSEELTAKCNPATYFNRTGTEEERTERGHLIEEIISLEEEANTRINVEIGAGDLGENFLEVEVGNDSALHFDENGQLVFDENEVLKEVETPPLLTKIRSEKKEADKDREESLKSLVKDLAAEPPGSRKRRRMTAEDELIMERQKHEMEMELNKFDLEKKTRLIQLELEKKKLDIEDKREDRLAAENKRSDEIQQSQIRIQNVMCDLLSKFMKN